MCDDRVVVIRAYILTKNYKLNREQRLARQKKTFFESECDHAKFS